MRGKYLQIGSTTNADVRSVFGRPITLISAGFREAANCRYCFYSQAKKQHFRPTWATRCTDAREIWHSWGLRGTWVRLVVFNFAPIGSRVNAAPKVENFHFLAKRSPAWANPLTISTILGAFIRPTALRKCFKFDVILLRRYGVIAKEFFGYCWETARLSFSPKFSVHPVGKTVRWIEKWLTPF